MAVSATWVPMRWPEGWSDPSLLDLLKGTPVNCLVFLWGDRKPAAALVEEGRRRGLALVGLIEGAGDRAAAIRDAQAAHLDAIALDTPAQAALPVIAWGEKSKLNWHSPAAGFAIADGVWPSIPSKDSAEGGPTGAPWVDSNGWMVQMGRSLALGKTVWVNAVPPKEGTIRPEHYELAVADAGAYGGRWVVTLDEKLSAALAARNPKALETWKGIARTTAFFEAHRDWADFPPCANIAVVSDFSGPNEYVGQELLNLLPRRGVPYRVIDRPRAAAAPLDGLAGILYPDQQAPDAALRQRLSEFVAEGGVLLANAGWPAPQGVVPSKDVFGRWKIYASGKGRLAIAAEAGLDPYLMAGDAQLIVGRRHDLVRYFNFGSLNGYYTASPRTAVLHVLNYAANSGSDMVSVVLMRSCRGARLWRPGVEVPEPVEMQRLPQGIELHLPPVGAYAAVELEG
ncbi:MAG TPA: hypothetical protein VF767_01545 [Bryobacteraceae bacterium]